MWIWSPPATRSVRFFFVVVFIREELVEEHRRGSGAVELRGSQWREEIRGWMEQTIGFDLSFPPSFPFPLLRTTATPPLLIKQITRTAIIATKRIASAPIMIATMKLVPNFFLLAVVVTILGEFESGDGKFVA
ncbi:hypothetical protein LINPERHAP1_LOCUS13141, partial [Linum perenne]